MTLCHRTGRSATLESRPATYIILRNADAIVDPLVHGILPGYTMDIARCSRGKSLLRMQTTNVKLHSPCHNDIERLGRQPHGKKAQRHQVMQWSNTWLGHKMCESSRGSRSSCRARDSAESCHPPTYAKRLLLRFSPVHRSQEVVTAPTSHKEPGDYFAYADMDLLLIK